MTRFGVLILVYPGGWMDAATKDISIVAYSNSTAILTNDFTTTVDAASGAGPVFVVSADVQNAAADGTVVGTASLNICSLATHRAAR